MSETRYSRLAGADEDRILARLRTLRSDLIDPTIAVHHGASSSAPDTFEFIWDKTPQKSHLRDLPYSECPALFAHLIAMGSTTALALAYLMLCGSRSGAALRARW